LQAYGEIQALLRSLRESRDALDQATVQKLQHTSAKLLEVSSATEVAATGILDSLDRATAMVDALDALDASGASGAADVRNKLRDELFHSISCLQFQDITTQQLRYASSMIEEMEQRMAGLAQALDPANLGAPFVPLTPPKEQAFDPGATLDGAEVRQSLADSIFTIPA
jgi:chemotaxis regulatin CheY-phosphate phosphatase CheZ